METRNRRRSPVREMLGRPITVYPVLVKLTGSVNAAIMLAQALYWMEVQHGESFYKSVADWETETCLSRTEQEGARRLLRKLPFWVEFQQEGSMNRCLHYKVDEDLLWSMLLDLVNSDRPADACAGNLRMEEQETCAWKSRFPADEYIRVHRVHTETTAETTPPALSSEKVPLTGSTSEPPPPQPPDVAGEAFAQACRLLRDECTPILGLAPAFRPSTKEGQCADVLTAAILQGIPVTREWLVHVLQEALAARDAFAKENRRCPTVAPGFLLAALNNAVMAALAPAPAPEPKADSRLGEEAVRVIVRDVVAYRQQTHPDALPSVLLGFASEALFKRGWSESKAECQEKARQVLQNV